MRRSAQDQRVPRVAFAKGQRKDDVMHQHLAEFLRLGNHRKRIVCQTAYNWARTPCRQYQRVEASSHEVP